MEDVSRDPHQWEEFWRSSEEDQPSPTNSQRVRITREEMFSRVCQVVAQRSTCLRSQVGAILVKDGRIISIGYNGPVSGMPVCVEPPVDWSKTKGDLPKWLREGLNKTYCQGPGCTRSCHAETNAIAFAAKAGMSVDGCTMYCTMSPCINCAKVIVNSGIRKLVYLEDYRDQSGIDLLKKAEVEVVKLTPSQRYEHGQRRGSETV